RRLASSRRVVIGRALAAIVSEIATQQVQQKVGGTEAFLWLWCGHVQCLTFMLLERHWRPERQLMGGVPHHRSDRPRQTGHDQQDTCPDQKRGDGLSIWRVWTEEAIFQRDQACRCCLVIRLAINTSADVNPSNTSPLTKSIARWSPAAYP